MELSEDQITEIRNRIRSEGITRHDLEEDLLDHLCCLIESEMQTTSFEAAIHKVWGDFAPKGNLGQIQIDINLMFNNKTLSMKKIAFLLSASGLILFFLATLLQGLRLMNNYEWRYMEELAFATQYMICLFLLPFYWLHQYRLANDDASPLASTKRLMFFTGFLCSEALVNAVFFKLMHLPGGNQLFVATAVLGMIYAPLYVVRKYRLLFQE